MTVFSPQDTLAPDTSSEGRDSPQDKGKELSAPDAKRKLLLEGAVVGLFILALLGIWGVVSAYLQNGGGDASFWISLALAVGSLLGLSFLMVREAKMAEQGRLNLLYRGQLDQLQNRLSSREDMLRLISGHQSGALSIFDRHNRYWFVNAKAAAQLGKDAAEIIGKPPVKVMSNELAKKLEVRLAEARAADDPLEVIERVHDKGGQTRFVQRHFEAVSEIAEVSGCVLLREEDLTGLIVERERREQMLRQVIETLVAVVDRRDPYASGHSSRVGQLAKVIAQEMSLDSVEVEAAEIAGSLMNFGKVLVSRRILTKTSALTPEELQRVRESILTSSEILGIIGFEGPVVPTLRQVLERYDGTGTPEGLKGEDILITARIVSVANAFVAFVSPRAHRDSLSFREALACMSKEAGKAYDERVLVALSHYIENRPNKLDWLKVKTQA